MTARRAPRIRALRLRSITLALGAILSIGTLGGCGTGCPAALLEGVLVRDDATLVVHADDGVETPVQWPGGYSIGTDGVLLVVKDLFGSIKAREGDRVHLGGGMVGDPQTAFGVCGDFTVDEE